eukprot:1786374-Heterocapsa_arctica.AAC.1
MAPLAPELQTAVALGGWLFIPHTDAYIESHTGNLKSYAATSEPAIQPPLPHEPVPDDNIIVLQPSYDFSAVPDFA